MKQIGITSFGLAFGCELGFHAAFTRVSKYQKQFREIISNFQFHGNVPCFSASFLEFIETETGVEIDP